MPRLPQQDLDHVLEHTGSLWEDLRGQSVFLTGGTGFVGTWILESLLWASDRLGLGVAATVLTRDPGRFREHASHLAEHSSVHILTGDITSFDFPDGAYPYIIHAATQPAFAPEASRPLGLFDADVAGTRRVLEFARCRGARKLLFTSSGAVYGPQPAQITHVPEDYLGAPSPLDSGSAYGQAKRVAEFMCAMYGRACGFDAVIARMFAFVGPLLPLDTNFAVGNFIRDALAGGPVRIAGDGTPRRSYLYAADLAIWLWTMLLRGKSGYPYNVGSAQDLSIDDLARTVVRVVTPGAAVEVGGKPVPGAPPLRYVPRTLRAQSELGLQVLIPVDEGIRRTAAWHRAAGRGAPASSVQPAWQGAA